MTDRSVAARRLVSLLQKIRDRLCPFRDSLERAQAEGSDYFPAGAYGVSPTDVATAVGYLHDCGLVRDGERLRKEFRDVERGFNREWLGNWVYRHSDADREGMNRRFDGAFPPDSNPNDRAKTDGRRNYLCAYVSAFLEYLNDIIGNVTATCPPAGKTEPVEEDGAVVAALSEKAAGERPVYSASSESALVASTAEYDFFICHATEDKDNLVSPLAAALQQRDARVWFDAYTLNVGDSLRRSIDQGLAKSRFGVVVLSHAFFEKNWPKYELDGLVAREVAGAKVILPIWHGVSKDDVCRFSPTLADRVALDTSSLSVEEIADALCRVLHSDAQPL